MSVDRIDFDGRTIDVGVPEPGSEEELQRLRTLVDHLRAALESRPVIEQAKGVLMARERCTPEEAFEALRRASQRENRRVRDLARDLVERAQRR